MGRREDTQTATDLILKENERRNNIIHAPFDPISGLNSIGERKEVHIADFPIVIQHLPIEMLDVPLVKKLIKLGTVDALVKSLGTREEDYAIDREKTIQQLVRIRCRFDFPFWAAMFVYIKMKGGGQDKLFRLNRPQRRYISLLEDMRKASKPIRVVLLKARQWGGSTASQMYMAWLQLCHKTGLNSLIIAQQADISYGIKDMFDRMLKSYPIEMLHELGDAYYANEPKLVSVGRAGGTYRVPQRNCKIKIGSAKTPDSCRGEDYSLVHLSEVGLWTTTDGKSPKDIVRSACSGVLFEPNTMIAYESTANGVGNFFHTEYEDAKKGISQFRSLFISWFEIDMYSVPIDDIRAFAERLYLNKDNTNTSSSREQSGRYLWWLWEKGATLEAINWYIAERAKYNDHSAMASEYPTDDVEAFVHSGQMVFDKYAVEKLRHTCKSPKVIGDIYSRELKGKDALVDLHFTEDKQGQLWIWDYPDISETEKITDRYLVVVDVGGRSDKADYSVIVVFDRIYMIDGDAPCVVAQWYGHCDIDILAWKAAKIAAYYDNALLVIEKNTIDKYDHERQHIDDNYGFILGDLKNVYRNLYARAQSEEDIRRGLPRKYGFHTNVSNKSQIIETLGVAIRDCLYIERDERCIDEYLVYERKPNGAYGAILGKHDDLLMTRAIGLRICFYQMDVPKILDNNVWQKNYRTEIISEATF